MTTVTLYFVSLSDDEWSREKRVPTSPSHATVYRSGIFCGFNCGAVNYADRLHWIQESKGGCSQEILLGFYVKLSSCKSVLSAGLCGVF